LDIIVIKKKTNISIKTILVPLIKCVIITVPSLFAVQWLFSLLENLHIILSLAISTAVSLTAFILLALAFNVLPLSVVWGKIKGLRKIKTKKRKDF